MLMPVRRFVFQNFYVFLEIVYLKASEFYFYGIFISRIIDYVYNYRHR